MCATYPHTETQVPPGVHNALCAMYNSGGKDHDNLNHWCPETSVRQFPGFSGFKQRVRAFSVTGSCLCLT